MQMVKWGLKAVGGLALNLALLTVWVDGLGFAAWWAVGINWVLISLVGYVVTDLWVFRGEDSPAGLVSHIKQYVGMQTVMATSKGANWAIYVALLSVGVDYRVAWLTGAVVVFLGTFAGNAILWRRLSVSESA
jgi:putative flippase GtrA